jgi:hypothetical protein
MSIEFEERPKCTAGPYFEGKQQDFEKCPSYGSPLAECVGWVTCNDCRTQPTNTTIGSE